MIPNKKLPKYLKGISPEPRERFEYKDAMSNAMRLVEYQALNKDLLNQYDYAVMMKIETERDSPREHILSRIKPWYDGERRQNEMGEIVKMLGGGNK